MYEFSLPPECFWWMAVFAMPKAEKDPEKEN
jgi:hypothetical protein